MIGRLSALDAQLPIEGEGCECNYYQFPIRFATSQERDFMSLRLLNMGIDAARYLDGVVDIARRTYGYDGSFKVAEVCSKTTLVVPNYYTISEKIDEIASAVLAAHQLFKTDQGEVNRCMTRKLNRT